MTLVRRSYRFAVLPFGRATGALACGLTLLLVSIVAPGAEFFVSPAGSPAGQGGLSSPWDLATALAQPSAVHAGDTIWLRGGTYAGSFFSHLTGTANAPVVVRQYPGERATLDGAGSPSSDPTLAVFGSWTVYRDFEVTNSDRNRPIARYLRPTSVVVKGPNTKFVNMVVHDGGQGFGFWSEAPDSEIYGCLVYYNGETTFDHGIYVQNQIGVKRIVDNIIFNNSGHGIHGYSEAGGYLNNLQVEGNTSFQNGDLFSISPQRNLLIGGEVTAQNPWVIGNYLYHQSAGESLNIGYAAGCTDAVITGNYVVGSSTVNCSSGTAVGSTYYGSVASQLSFSDNAYLTERPTGSRVFIRPNAYESGRANITVYNWDLQDSVAVNLSSIIPVGAPYQVRNAQNYFGEPIVAGVYDGEPVQIPMRTLRTATPVGLPVRSPSSAEFGVFVISAQFDASLAPTPSSPTPSATWVPQPRTQPQPPASSGTPGGRVLIRAALILSLALAAFLMVLRRHDFLR